MDGLDLGKLIQGSGENNISHRFSRRLQKLSRFKSDPDLEHARITFAHAFDQGAAAALRAKLAENWKCA